jgi:hypothetical protein
MNKKTAIDLFLAAAYLVVLPFWVKGAIVILSALFRQFDAEEQLLLAILAALTQLLIWLGIGELTSKPAKRV